MVAVYWPAEAGGRYVIRCNGEIVGRTNSLETAWACWLMFRCLVGDFDFEDTNG
jgi:hypothetical protein